MTPPTPESSPLPPDAAERPPGFRTWRGVYGFVFACFVLQVALLAMFTWLYS